MADKDTKDTKDTKDATAEAVNWSPIGWHR